MMTAPTLEQQQGCCQLFVADNTRLSRREGSRPRRAASAEHTALGGPAAPQPHRSLPSRLWGGRERHRDNSRNGKRPGLSSSGHASALSRGGLTAPHSQTRRRVFAAAVASQQRNAGPGKAILGLQFPSLPFSPAPPQPPSPQPAPGQLLTTFPSGMQCQRLGKHGVPSHITSVAIGIITAYFCSQTFAPEKYQSRLQNFVITGLLEVRDRSTENGSRNLPWLCATTRSSHGAKESLLNLWVRHHAPPIQMASSPCVRSFSG